MKPPQTQRDFFVFDTPEQVAEAAAERFVEYGAEAVKDRGVFSVALSGGKTPQRVYELLATDRFRDRVQWSQVNLFFGDERAVPPGDPDSNYEMAYETLISKVPIPARNVHRMIGEGDPRENARSYEGQLKSFFAGLLWPRFDLVFMGMGADGHTASVFPGGEALHEKAGHENSRWVLATKSPAGQDRITLTLPVFNHAAQIVFLVTGKEKAQRLSEVLRPVSREQQAGGSGQDLLPVQMIQPVEGKLEWLIDRAAAALL